jgi:hypothetical protein
MFLSCDRNQKKRSRIGRGNTKKDGGEKEEDELVGSKKRYEKQRSQS